jgi:hypothetical protein
LALRIALDERFVRLERIGSLRTAPILKLATASERNEDDEGEKNG